MAHVRTSRHPAVQYAHDVLDGTVIAGRLVRLAIERDLHDLEHGRARGLRFDPVRASKAVDWFKLCRQYDGEFAGQPLEQEPWQQWITWVTYGWLRANGTRRFRERAVIVGSGNGKTTWSAADALLGLLGDGEPGAEVYSAAVHSDQARILWNAARLMVEQSPALSKRVEVHDAINNRRLVYAAGNAFMVPLAREAAHSSSEGKKPHRVYFDELHEYRDRKQYDVLRKKMVKRRQPLATIITTAGDDEPETLYEEIYDYCVSVLEGWQNGDFVDDSFLAYVAEIDQADDPFADGVTEDEMLAMVAKANPNLGVSVHTDALVEHWRRGQRVEAERGSFLRYSCNRRASTVAREIQPDEWDACADRTIDWADFRAIPCIAAVDLSSTVDLTAITQVWRRDDFWYYRFHAFLPEDNLRAAVERDNVPYDRWAAAGWLTLTPGNAIDDAVIARKVLDLDAEHNVAQWATDPWHMKFVANAVQREDGPELVAMLQDLKTFAEPTMLFLDELRTGRMRHDGNPLARWCALNLVTKEDAHGNRKPHKRASKKRIDPIVAAVIARGRAIVVDLAAPPSVWDGSIQVWA